MVPGKLRVAVFSRRGLRNCDRQFELFHDRRPVHRAGVDMDGDGFVQPARVQVPLNITAPASYDSPENSPLRR